MSRKVSFQPIAEMTGEPGGSEFLTGEEIRNFVTPEQDPGFVGTEWAEGHAPAATPHHPWISYSGSDIVYGPDCQSLSPETELFVTRHDSKVTSTKMTVAQLVAGRDASDAPDLYRVV